MIFYYEVTCPTCGQMFNDFGAAVAWLYAKKAAGEVNLTLQTLFANTLADQNLYSTKVNQGQVNFS